VKAKVAAAPTTATAQATNSRCATPSKSPRFQASSGPNGTATSSARNNGPKVELKKGGPIDSFIPVEASRASGYNVPKNTVRQATVRNKLFRTSAPSRETGANKPPCLSIGARQANSVKAPPMNRTMIARMNTPRVGSLAKACTEVSTPERTMKVPINDSEKVKIASRIVHTFSAFRFSMTSAECNSAVPASQGMNEAFSTGSQNHQPPHPSS
jgi:hypothetical protein